MAETVLSGLMVSMEKEQSMGLFFLSDEVARHKDE